jgi:shikimate 5-dehydrogenase
VRTTNGWRSANTDVDAARSVLQRLSVREVVVLGDGGVASAIREAAATMSVRTSVLRRADVSVEPLTGSLIWTWPERVPIPTALTFRDARVVVVAYGAPARRIADDIRRRGGRVESLGAHWFVAQARRQRALWETATPP